MTYVQALLGLSVFIAIPFALSENRRAVSWRMVGIGLGLQVALALLLTFLPGLAAVFQWLSQAVVVLDQVTQEATAFMFGFLAGGPPPFAVTDPNATFLVAFRILPLIWVIGALSALLFHWGVLPWFIRLLARGLQKSLGLSGPLSFGAGAAVFLGTIETPLLIRPYLSRMSRSDLFALLCATMATIAGTVMVLYAGVVGKVVDQAVGHLLTASLISVPAAIILARIWIPHSAAPSGAETATESVDLSEIEIERAPSALSALLRSIEESTKMIIQIIAIIIVMFAFVYLTNRILGLIPSELPWTLGRILGLLLQPVMWLVGISWAAAGDAGSLMGTKIVLNELVAYFELAGLAPEVFAERERIIITYALCGFANLGSLGIVAGGLSSLVPERQTEIVGLAMRSVVVGNLATLMTAAIISFLV